MPFTKLAKTFYFIRHGRTDANVQKLWCGGDWDIELNEEGHSQAQVAAKKFSEIAHEIDKIFASPMIRAQQTTKTLNLNSNKPIITVDQLREWRVGELDRKPWAASILGQGISEWQNPPGGETVEQFRERVQTAVLHCLQNASCPLISSHGAVGRIMIHLLKMEDMHLDNATLCKITPEFNNSILNWKLKIL